MHRLALLALVMAQFSIGQQIEPLSAEGPQRAYRIVATPISPTRDLQLPPERHRSLFALSVSAYFAAQTADLATSWNRYEANPILARDGKFSSQSALLKAGIAGAVVATEWLILRRHPSMKSTFVWVNFGAAGATGAVAAHNASLRR